MPLSHVNYLADIGPGPRDVVVVREGKSAVLHVPDGSEPDMKLECRSYDEALIWGLRLARDRNVDFWAVEREITCLIARRIDN